MKDYMENTLSIIKDSLIWIKKNFFRELKDEFVRLYFNNKTEIHGILAVILFIIVLCLIPKVVAFLLFFMCSTAVFSLCFFVVVDLINLEELNYPIIQITSTIIMFVIIFIIWIFSNYEMVKFLWH